MKLEDLQPNATVRGLLPDAAVTVVSTQWHGADALTLIYRNPAGRVAEEILYRHDEPRPQVIEHGRPWSFDGDGALFRLVSEAHRIRLAHLFDPVLAVHTSLVEPLPHQITAVYEAMLPRQPLRFLLADDPGAGKTIMAALFIKELIARGDLKRCLIVCPGSLVEQWQDELSRKFQLPFEILTNDKLEAARTGNWFLENDLAIARLDKLSRNEDVQAKLSAPDCHYDLIVCDEAHKLSATFFGGDPVVQLQTNFGGGKTHSMLALYHLLSGVSPSELAPHTGSDDVEVGGIRGREALDRLRNVVGRLESSWRPATAEEGFEIVRRRLFEPLAGPEAFKHRDVTARAFADLYRAQSAEFPNECRGGDYEKRIQAAYPIHPEIFDRHRAEQ